MEGSGWQWITTKGNERQRKAEKQEKQEKQEAEKQEKQEKEKRGEEEGEEEGEESEQMGLTRFFARSRRRWVGLSCLILFFGSGLPLCSASPGVGELGGLLL